MSDEKFSYTTRVKKGRKVIVSKEFMEIADLDIGDIVDVVVPRKKPMEKVDKISD